MVRGANSEKVWKYAPSYSIAVPKDGMEDCNDDGIVSARILMPGKALLDWVEIV